MAASGPRATVIRAMIGSAVHVREDDTCRAGVVLAVGIAPTDRSYVLIRVYHSTARGLDAGADDTEGWYWHVNAAMTVDRPGGGTRTLDAWHWADDRDPDCSRLARGVESRP